MGSQAKTAPALAAFLAVHQQPIVTAWARLVQQLPATPYAACSRAELEQWAAEGLTAITRALLSGSSGPLQDYLSLRCMPYVQQGSEIGQVLDALLLCKEAVAPLLWQEHRADAQAEVSRLDSCLRQAARHLVEIYSSGVSRYLHKQRQRADLMLDAARAVSRSRDLDVALAQIAEAIATAAGGATCAIYLLDHEQDMLVPRMISQGTDSAYQSAFYAHPLLLSSDPFARAVMTQRAPLVIPTDLQAQRIVEAPAMLLRLALPTALALPLMANERILGLALAGSPQASLAFPDEQIDLAWGLAHAAALAVEHAQYYEEIGQRLAESQSLQRVTTALLQELSLEAVLEVVCIEALELTGARGSSVVLLENHAWLRVAHSAGAIVPAFERMPIAGSFTGLAVQQGAPLLTNDPTREITLYQAWGEPTAFLVAPLSVHEKVIGAIDLVNKPGGFTADDMRIIRLFADQAAIAIEHARLYQQVEHLAIVSERQRLAHNLHDSVAQALYSLTLYTEAAARALHEGDGPKAASYLGELQEIASDALREMRLLIFNLRPPLLEQEGLVAALQHRLDAVESRAGLRTALYIEGEERLSPALQEQIYHIAQEALTNVLKHARAREVTISLAFGEGSIRLEICDNGRGFDPATVQTMGGLGIAGMHERSREIGGALAIQSAPGQGTTVRLEVPQ